MKTVELPSGATLKLNPAPFAHAKALNQAILREMKHVDISSETDMGSVYKDVFCLVGSSKEVEAVLWECMKRCLYCDSRGELKIDADTFELISAREDYMTVCMEVIKENCHPFVKSLWSEYGHILKALMTARK